MTYKAMDGFLEALEEGNYVAPAMNTTNLEMTIAIVEAAEETGCPVMVQIAPTNVKLSGYDYIAEIVKKKLQRTYRFQLLYIWIMV